MTEPHSRRKSHVGPAAWAVAWIAAAGPAFGEPPFAPAALDLATPAVSTAAPETVPRALRLERDWCTGTSPVSWGFSVTASLPATQLRLRVLSSGVIVIGARGGPGLPADWSVSAVGPREVLASGPTPLVPDETRRSLLVVDTNRSTGDITARRECLPVRWEVEEVCEGRTSRGEAAFQPVLELSDAVSRGVVLATLEPLSAAGPVEITVDNPTTAPLTLDLPPGTILTADGAAWVVGLVPAMDLDRRQKAGRTRDVFPLRPPTGLGPKPRRLALPTKPDPRGRTVTEIALAVERIRDRRGAGRTQGAFERLFPADFWHLATKWAVWHDLEKPPADLLATLVTGLLDDRAVRGDTAAQGLDRAAAVAEIDGLLPAVAIERVALGADGLDVDLLARRERFGS